jgi:catechol 2,3-dioxygenase-like lactoylglutathione lyase family enzyme
MDRPTAATLMKARDGVRGTRPLGAESGEALGTGPPGDGILSLRPDGPHMSENDSTARLVGINHVALPVGDVEAAVEFYESVFAFDVRGRIDGGAFLDMGDQFLALMENGEGTPGDGAGNAADTDGANDAAGESAVDDHRHIGLVVDDRTAVERALDDLGVETLPTGGLDFRDPWGNRLQVVAYEEIQFTKADHVRGGMGLSDLGKSAAALAELAEKGMAPEE